MNESITLLNALLCVNIIGVIIILSRVWGIGKDS